MSKPKLNHIKPPKASNIELRVIGGLIAIGNPNDLKVQNALMRLTDDCFYEYELRILFNIIKKLIAENQNFDIVNFIDHIPNDVSKYIGEFSHAAYYTAVYLEHDIDELLSYKILRKQLIILVNAVNESVNAVTVKESLDSIANHMRGLSLTLSSNTTIACALESYEMMINEILSMSYTNNAEFVVDIPNLPSVPNQSLITIAGRSGHGKTEFALYFMDKICDVFPEKQALYFNLEMNKYVLLERHAKLLGSKGSNRIEIIKDKLPELMCKNLSYINMPMISIEEIETICRLAFLKAPISVIVIDYIGLVNSKSRFERKDLEQSNIAKRLAALSLDLNCVVLALIQANREGIKRPIGERCPIPSDASESMGTVHSSSWWLGIDRPGLDDENRSELHNLFQVRCRKNRGEHGCFKIDLKLSNGRFYKWDVPFCNKPKIDDIKPIRF